jgi:hypothetical protein
MLEEDGRELFEGIFRARETEKEHAHHMASNTAWILIVYITHTSPQDREG